MKKLKKIISAAAALTVLSAVMPICSNAVYRVKSRAEYESILKEQGINELAKKYYPIYQHHGSGKLFISDNGTRVIAEKSKGGHDLFCKFDSSLFKGQDASECTDIFDSVCSTLKSKLGASIAIDYTEPISDSKADKYTFKVLYPSNISHKAVIKELQNIPEITNVEYAVERVQIENYYAKYGPAYYYIDEDVSYRGYLIDFAEKNFPNADKTYYDLAEKVVSSKDKAFFISILPKSGGTLDEKLDIALTIYEQLDIVPSAVCPEKYDDMIYVTVDVDNYVDGDANNDGVFTIADATIILQSLGNPDRYDLSVQGKFNADIYNVGDGVTGLDALEIQKILARK